MHGADERHLIGDAAHVGNKVAHLDAALAARLELPLRTHDLPAGTGGAIARLRHIATERDRAIQEEQAAQQPVAQLEAPQPVAE